MQSARVQSIDAVKDFKTALWKFTETATAVLSNADAEIQRTLTWLETEQHAYWEGQIRKRTELVAKAKDAVRAKKLFHPDGFRPAAVEEEQALRVAIARLEEADRKLDAVRRYARTLQKELLLYRGQVQRLGTDLSLDVPLAQGRLDHAVGTLEAYVALAVSEETGVPTDAGTLPEQASMAQPEPSVAPPVPPPEAPPVAPKEPRASARADAHDAGDHPSDEEVTGNRPDEGR